jgi:hypothetical protein
VGTDGAWHEYADEELGLSFRLTAAN